MGLDPQDEEWPDPSVFRSGNTPRIANLTPVQARVMDLMAEGLSNAAIGERLGIKENSAEAHVRNVYNKLGLTSGKGINRRVMAVLQWLGHGDGLHWRATCEFCPWVETDIPTRREAVALGHAHVGAKHGGDPEWSFRVQGLRERP